MTELTQTQTNEIAAVERLTTRQLHARLKKLTGKATARNAKRTTLIRKCREAIANPRPMPAMPAHKRRRQFDVGTVLTRTHKGETITVTVTDAGFEHDGKTYTSLSTLAKSICGYHVSGPAFFKLAGK